ncbi:MAG: DUF2380 domain-containing protein [Methylophaga sp.]
MKSLITFLFTFSLLACGGTEIAEKKVAVLDMEMLNLTLKLTDPKKNADIAAADQKNVELVQSLVRKGFEKRDNYTLIKISDEVHAKADKSVGYLFDRPEAAAKLGKTVGADYIVVGRYHKPTYLFSYIMLRVVDVNSGELVQEFKSEVKGRPQETIPRNIENLMIEVDELLSAQ